MDVWQRHDLEQSNRPAREQGDPARRGQPRRLLEIAAHALQIRRHAVARRPLQPLLLECLERLAHAVLHLDEVLAARLVARLELQVAGHDLVGPGAQGREALDGAAHRALGREMGQRGHGQKNTGSRYAPYTRSRACRIS